MVRLQSALAVLLIGFVVAIPNRSGAEASPVRHVPDVSLTTLDGTTIRLSDYRGKVLLVDFWATWCVPCQTEIPRFVAFQQKYSGEGFQVVGISMDDSAEPVRKFYARFKINYPVALADTKVADQFGGVLGLPLTFLVDRNGAIIKQYDGNANLDQMEDEIKSLLASAVKPH